MAIIINTGIESNSIDNKSFALLRTNPKLTSNVKLVVDSSSNLFLSSFKANKELSKVEYQKYPIDPKGEFSIDISRYYKKLPISSRYQVLRKYSDVAIYSDYEFQYEDQYQCGASFNSTKLYDEQYKIFAPIWLDKKIPSNFVIYRVSSVDYDKKHAETTEGQNGRILELLKNATIVKTFDLSIKSNIGKYLTNHVNDKQFSKSALTINFELGAKSSFNGIDIVKGGFVKKNEILEEYYTSTDYPEIFNNEIITAGFERNGVVPSNIINLEFLFDDDNAENYKIFRYFGLYTDAYDEGSFKPNYINGVGEITIDPASYKSFYDLSGTDLNDLDMLPNATDLSLPSLNYVKDKEGYFYHVNNLVNTSHIESNKITVALDRKITSFFEGYSKTGSTIEAVSKSNEFKGFIKLTITQPPSNNDKLFLFDKFELEIKDYNLGGFIMIADDSLPKGTFINNRFSTNGSLAQIAGSLNGAISQIGAGQYKSYLQGNSIVIEDYAYGNGKRQTGFGVYSGNISDFVRIDSAESNNLGLTTPVQIIPTGFCYSFLPSSGYYLLDYVFNPTNSYFYGSFTAYDENGATVAYKGLIKLNEDLTVDTSFNVGTGVNQILYSGSSIVQQTDGKIIATGTFTSYQGVSKNRIVRLNIDGSIDTSFVMGSGFNNFTQGAAIDSNGSIVVTGIFSNYNGTPTYRIARILSNGSIDSSFITGSGFNNTTTSVLINPDNSMYVVGYFNTYNGTNGLNGIIKLLPNGTRDFTFNSGSGVSPYFPNNANYLARIEGETSFYLGGYISSYNGTPVDNIVKIQSDGSIDTSFGTGSGFNGVRLYTLNVVWDDKLLIEGDFTEYNGVTSYYSIILNSDGTVYYAFDEDNMGPIIVGDNLFASNSGECIKLIYNRDGIAIQPMINAKFNEWDISTMIGGSEVDQAIVVKKQDIGLLQVGEFVSQLNSKNFTKIIEIELDPFNSDQYRVILDKPTIFTRDNVFEVYREYDVIHGKFSAYDFKDFDFDFYSTKNSELGELKYEVFEGYNTPSEFFTGLTPVLEADDIEDAKIIDVSSEYDRLRENELKETSLKSRVVPVINKFSLVDATNARSLDYVLNANEAFGSDNLSPNIKIASVRNPDYLNMEHFCINSIPDGYRSDVEKIKSITGFLDFNSSGGITKEGLKTTSFDYFKSFFKWSGAVGTSELIWINDKRKKLYTIFNSGGSIESDNSTVFRGLRYSYKKRKETTLNSPTDFIMTSEVVDYKFGVVLNYTNNGIENTAPITVIKNDVFKFICVYIDLVTYSNSISKIDRISSYLLDDLIETGTTNVKDIDIPFFIDFSASIVGEENDNWVLRASEFAADPDFLKYVTPDSDGRYSSISFDYLGSVYYCDVDNVIDSESVSIKGYPYLTYDGVIQPGLRFDPNEFALISQDPAVSRFKYIEGGSNVFNDLLESISAYEFSERFNKFNGVNYVTIDSSGNEVLNDFVLSIEDGVEFYKPSIITSVSDPEKPKAYQLSSGEVGRVIVDRTDGGYLTVLRRMNGDYNPIVKDVITFTDIYSENKLIRLENISEVVLNNARELLIYNKFNDLGVAFSSYKNTMDNYGYISNYFYHKVNDENAKNIIKLSQTSDKLPLYPAIGEIAIDRKDINLFKSKYSSDYFSKAIIGGKSEPAYGTLSPVEKINFMTSTIMKVKNEYDLLSFDSKEESSVNSLDDIRNNSLNTSSIHWYENTEEVFIDFYLPRSIAQELIRDGIKNSFSNYVTAANSFGNKESIDDDLELYINSNIVSRFIIDEIQIYGIESKNISTEFIPVATISELRSDLYKQLSNYTIKSYQNDSLSFRLIYNKRSGYSYKFKIHIKIQA